ncbi:DUF2306 domain-containing protein [Domibacillus sp. DTU_2020_1001157_1_SI_ALB_TIR_016]|uniref:DUF2306 domain-containing protein n=1 Tax=Domibacillus sp. DTU_2020_1001157_1_SI_ALB_TIR_016 TaxID=3077789 RepID=UPI0028ECCF6C|nr:DUF2306 domain-containing protein [Domibacillus sp. DTU_2020_1001157_1_SI_ALB_TIR_016]WNS81571.1 DUF2306 domain-containing protein [Domibacillus sp. DTU_2020_1001157_1_SI_ALB_TIR_016]
MSFFDLILMLHIFGGFAALFTFWIPLVTKKGGKAHRRSGWLYTSGMIAVAVSAVYLSTVRLIDPASSQETVSFSLFLLFIAVLSSSTAYYGIRVLRFKDRKGIHKQAVDLGFPVLLLFSSIGMSIYGFSQHVPLLSWFPVLGLFLSATQLGYWLRPPSQKKHWWFEHFGGMLSCSIATITAFTVFGAPRLLDIEKVSMLLWFIPTLLLTPVIIGLSIYYRKKF